MKRCTLAAPVELVGEAVRLHTNQVRLRLEPGDAGLAFRRLDTDERLPARIDQVVAAPNCTALGRDGQPLFHFVEHVLSALAGLGFTDAEVAVDGPEVPLFDGSARPLVDALNRAGRAWLPGELEPLRLREPVIYEAPGRRLEARPAEVYSVHYTFAHEHPVIAHDEVTYDSGDYAAEIAPARTFATTTEIELLRQHGLLRGGSEDNLLLVRDDGFASPLRLPHEIAAHKVLDQIGDLALLGRPLAARVVAQRTGHADNHAFTRLLLRTQ